MGSFPHSPLPTPHSPLLLRLATTSALIPSMRTAKFTITILLALQLFVTAGLCGGVCCATTADQMGHGDAAAKENYKPATEEKIEGGHCPMHAAKEAKPKLQERKQPSSETAQHSAATHHRYHRAGSSSAIDAHFCACSVKREERPFDALLQKSPEQRPGVQTLPGAIKLAHWLVESSPAQTPSPESARPHAPPFCGLQLHLRI